MCEGNYAQSCLPFIEQKTHSNPQTNTYDPQPHEMEKWEDQPKLANQLVSMVTCRPYPDDVVETEKG